MSTFWSFCTFLTLISMVHSQQRNGARCQLPIDPGNCGVLSVLSTPTLRYGYDRTSARCIQFTYSGCGGNTNRFTTYNQCLTTCFYAQEVSFNDFINLVGLVLTVPTKCNENKQQTIMTNFNNYYCMVIFLFLIIITRCKTDDVHDSEMEDCSGLEVDFSGLDLVYQKDVCGLPIDEGDCRDDSLGTNEINDSDSATDELHELKELNALNELDELNRLKELSESYESKTRYFGYNKNTMRCEQFYFDGCGGNANRFDYLNDCRKTCYTTLKYFLSKVTDLLMFRFTNETSGLPA